MVPLFGACGGLEPWRDPRRCCLAPDMASMRPFLAGAIPGIGASPGLGSSGGAGGAPGTVSCATA